MRFAQFLRPEKGSNTVGFALVAPILTGSFLAVMQIANLVNVQVSLSAAAKSAAREASRFDGTFSDGLSEASRILDSQGISAVEKISVHRTSQGNLALIEVVIEKKYRVPWLNYEFKLSAAGKSLDEKSLN